MMNLGMMYAEAFNAYCAECKEYARSLKERFDNEVATLDEINKASEMANTLKAMFSKHKRFGVYCSRDSKMEIRGIYYELKEIPTKIAKLTFDLLLRDDIIHFYSTEVAD